LLALPLQRSGFNRFYQHFRWKTLIAGKTFTHKKTKDPAQHPGLYSKLKNHSNSSDEDDGDDGDDDDGHTRSQEPLYQREQRLQWQQEITCAAS
jgi:hypothetical protein